MFDRELHDRLLQEVMAADVQAPGLTLMNTVAKERAEQLLDSGDDYF
jgi:signal transduction histidine kinase